MVKFSGLVLTVISAALMAIFAGSSGFLGVGLLVAWVGLFGIMVTICNEVRRSIS